jgi:hypothetical protein
MDEYDNPNPKNSSDITAILLALTLTFVSLAGALYFASQLGSINQGITAMKWQTEHTDKLITAVTKQHDELVKNIEILRPQAATSEQTQKQFAEIMKELDEMARAGDKEAEMIIKTYGVKVNDNDKKDGEKTEKTEEKK